LTLAFISFPSYCIIRSLTCPLSIFSHRTVQTQEGQQNLESNKPTTNKPISSDIDDMRSSIEDLKAMLKEIKERLENEDRSNKGLLTMSS
jgi:hypothetical protein